MDYEKIGRARMMVRLPSHRIPFAEQKTTALRDLFENYGRALVKRDELRAQSGPLGLIAHYEELCQLLEDKAVKLISRPRLIR
ncbi:hypothetical protein [Ensifer sp.]|uniref:hypothetical protein n=1 Tax=Ensifer sp. TaxID=1872086 RepID=UPI00289E80B8|nr:hypothetical protein [Ensifer sp.]